MSLALSTGPPYHDEELSDDSVLQNQGLWIVLNGFDRILQSGDRFPTVPRCQKSRFVDFESKSLHGLYRASTVGFGRFSRIFDRKCMFSVSMLAESEVLVAQMIPNHFGHPCACVGTDSERLR